MAGRRHAAREQPVDLAGRVLRGGPESVSFFSRLLDTEADDRFSVDSVRWNGDRFEVTIGGRNGDAVTCLVEGGETEGRAFAASPHLRLRYQGDDVPRSLGAILELAVAHWGALTLEELLRHFSEDAELEAQSEAGVQPGVSRERGLDRFPFLTVERVGLPGDPAGTQMHVRVSSRCNQACRFCQASLSTRDPIPTTGELLACLAEAVETAPNAKWALTGGEPTTRKDIVAITRALVEEKRTREVSLQTNAVAIGRRPARFEFPASRKLTVLVGFHHTDEALYDACTGTTGLLPSAVRGVTHLLEHGFDTELNCVVHQTNVGRLDEMVRALPQLFGDKGPRLRLTVMAEPEHREAADLFVRYTDLVAAVDGALRLADSTGVRASASLSAHHTAVPPCLLTDRLKARSEYPDLYAHEGVREDPQERWRRGAACERCAFGERCRGLPAHYAARFGVGELRPIDSGAAG